MDSISLDPRIKLNESEMEQGKGQSENFNRFIPSDAIDRLNRDHNFPVSPRFENLKESGKGQAGFNFYSVDLKKNSIPYE